MTLRPEASAVEFADALEGAARKADVDSAVSRAVQEIKTDAAERESRVTRRQQLIIGIVMGGLLTQIGFAIAILLAVLL